MAARSQIVAALYWASIFSTAAIANAAVDVSGTDSCVQRDAATPALEEVLQKHAGEREVDLLISVTETRGDGSTVVSLRAITGAGEKVLDREFALSSADCASATELLCTVVDRFVQALPLQKWTLQPKRVQPQAPPPPPPPPSPPPPLVQTESLSLSVAAKLGADLQIAPMGGSFEGGLVGDVGRGTHALSLDIGVRGSSPRALGQGSYYTLILAGGVGWRLMSDAWLGRLAARAGAIRVAGSGFTSDGAAWLPWAELDAGLGRRLGPVALLLTGAVSPFRHSAVTADGSLKQELSNVRLGLSLEVPLVETDF